MEATLLVLAIVVGGLRIAAHYLPRVLSRIFDRYPQHFKPSQESADTAALIERVVEVFGGVSQAQVWLDRSNRALSGATPRSLISTAEGRERVLTILGRLEHGVYS